MTCSCQCGVASFFNRRRALSDRKRYERRGPDPSTRMLLDELRPVTRPGDTLLDIGGGIGVIDLELRKLGHLAETTLIDAAADSIAVAQDLRSGAHAARFRVIAGDVTEMVPPSADIVTLDRVVCCHHDFTALLGTAAASARRVLAWSYPHDRWYIRLLMAAGNLFLWASGSRFRAFVHRPQAMAAVLEGAGFRQHARRSTMLWVAERWELEGAA